MESLRKSFKSAQGSHKYTCRISAEAQEQNHELQPILLDLDERMSKSDSSDNHREVVLNIDGNNNSNRHNGKNANSRESDGENAGQSGAADADGFSFHQRPQGPDGPLPKLIVQFLHEQTASGEIALDKDELRYDRNLPPMTESPMNHRQTSSRELKASFQGSSPTWVETAQKLVRRRYTSSFEEDEHNQIKQHNGGSSNIGGGSANSSGRGRGEVLRCTSSASYRRNSSLLKAKTKSRLMDPPEDQDRKSGRVAKSGQVKSGMLGRINNEDEDDSFSQEDVPEEYKKGNISALTLLEWVSLILILATLVCSLSIPALSKKLVWRLHLWKWEVLVLVVICGRLVSGWGIRLVVFFIERNFLLRKRVLYFVYGVRKAVKNCIWLGLVLIAWHAMLDKKVARETNTSILPFVTKILFCFLVATLIWLVKTLLVKVLASSFHVSTYFDRIQESLFNQYVIETLSGPPLIEIQHAQEENEKVMAEVRNLQNAGATMPPDLRATVLPTTRSGKVIGSGGLQRSPKAGKSGTVSKQQDEGITIDHLHKLNQKNISAWNMKRLMNIVRHGVLSTLDETILGSAHTDESTMQIRSECEAKAAAKKIFNNVAMGGSKYIYLEDLMRFLREDEASKTMSLFEGATESKRISKSALKNWVVNAFRERRALALTLNDTKTAVNKLHQMLNIIVGIIILIIWLIILGIATTHLLVAISSQVLVVVFIFGNTCKTVFESIIFLFAMHPFDVGDRCEVDGVQMIVEEMNILTTVFLRYDNQKIIYPNSVLSTKPISNYYRSPDMGDAVEFCIHISTPAEKIAIMKQRITEYIENKKDHWYPGPMVVVKDVEDMNRLKIAIWLTHRMNHQDMGERWSRRALLVEEMVKVFRELDIEYRMLPLDINVRNMPALTSTRFPSNWTACSN